MMLKIKKLGPMKDSEIELGDITLLLGPPNTGKSYTLKAIYTKLFPLDDYVLDAVKKTFSKVLMRYLKREIPEHILSELYDLLKVMIKVFMAAMALSEEDRTYSKFKEYITAIAGKEFQVTIEKQEDLLLVNIEASPIEVNIETNALKQSLQETFYEFTSKLLPIENIDSITFEPIDLLRLDIKYVTEVAEHEARIETRHLLLLVEELLDYIDYYSVRTLEQRYEDLRRLPIFPMGRLLRDLIKYLSVALNLKINIRPNIETIGLVFAYSLSLRIHTRIPLLPEEMKEISGSPSLQTINEILDEIFEKSKGDLRLNRNINRIIGYISDTMLKTCANVISRTILYDGLREVVINRLGYNSLRFIPFGRSVFVLGIESASREPFTRPRFLRSFIDVYPDAFASYVYWASKGRNILLEGKFTGSHRKILEAAAPLLEGRLVSDTAGRILYRDWRSSVVDLQASSALVEEVAGLIFTLLTTEEDSIILIEEPEAQLHPGAQIVMALFLASLPSLCRCKVVASTHSDLLAVTLSQLAVQKPSKEWVKELIERLLPHVKEEVDALSNVVAETVENLDLRVYEFTREGTVKSVRPEDILGREVPGINRVIDELTDWAFLLASYKASGEVK